MTALIDQALNSVAGHWQGGNVTVLRDYGRDLPLVPLDEKLCEQAFLNLVQNAYEAMEPDGGSLRVAVSAARLNGWDGVEIRLQDSGPGVPRKCVTRFLILLSRRRRPGSVWDCQSSRKSLTSIRDHPAGEHGRKGSGLCDLLSAGGSGKVVAAGRPGRQDAGATANQL